MNVLARIHIFVYLGYWHAFRSILNALCVLIAWPLSTDAADSDEMNGSEILWPSIYCSVVYIQ